MRGRDLNVAEKFRDSCLQVQVALLVIFRLHYLGLRPLILVLDMPSCAGDEILALEPETNKLIINAIDNSEKTLKR